MPDINETMGQYSELFMLLAAGTYTVAFIAFAWDLARSSKALRTVDLRAASAAPALASRPARVPVSAGTSAAADRAASGVGGPAGIAERPSSAARQTGADAAGAGQTAEPGMGYAPEQRMPARIGVALTVLGALIHGAGVLTRALGAGRVPWGNMYEFLTTGAFAAVAVFLLALIRRDLRFLGTFVVGLVIIMQVAASGHRANDRIFPDRQRTVAVLRHPERNLAGGLDKGEPRRGAPAPLGGRDHAA